jgi:YD repeat-containing protein
MCWGPTRKSPSPSTSYDNADRVTGIVNTHSASENEEFVYGYDANSNRQSETRKRNCQHSCKTGSPAISMIKVAQIQQT